MCTIDKISEITQSHRKQSQTQRCIVVRSPLVSYIHSPRSHLGISLYPPLNTVELFYKRLTTQTFLVSQANQEPHLVLQAHQEPQLVLQANQQPQLVLQANQQPQLVLRVYQQPHLVLRLTKNLIQELKDKCNKREQTLVV